MCSSDLQYEWFAHEQHALKGGLSPAIIAAIKAGQRPDFRAEDETIIYDYAHELHTGQSVSDQTYQRAQTAFGRTGVVELTALLGYYSLIAMTLNAHDIPVPDGAAPPLPPRAG